MSEETNITNVSRTPADADLRVLFFGDSFVAGVGDPDGRGWVGRVVAASFAAGVPLTPYNLGVRGETSLQVAARWRAEASPRLSPDAVARVVVSVGANDVAQGVASAESVAALNGILEGVSEAGASAFVVGPPPVVDGDAGALLTLSERFAAVCGALGVPFVPVAAALLADSSWTAEALAGDGAHPAAGGYDALAALVLRGGWLTWLLASG